MHFIVITGCDWLHEKTPICLTLIDIVSQSCYQCLVEQFHLSFWLRKVLGCCDQLGTHRNGQQCKMFNTYWERLSVSIVFGIWYGLIKCSRKTVSTIDALAFPRGIARVRSLHMLVVMTMNLLVCPARLPCPCTWAKYIDGSDFQCSARWE